MFLSRLVVKFPTAACCDALLLWYPFGINIKIEILFAHNILRGCPIILKFNTHHTIDFAVICAKWSNDWITTMGVKTTRFREFLPKKWVSEGYLRLLKGFVRSLISASLTMLFWKLICCFHLLFGSVVLLDTSIVSASLLVYSHLKKLASWGGLKYLALMIR